MAYTLRQRQILPAPRRSSLADVLFGDVNSSGRLPVTVPVRLEDSGAAKDYPGTGGHLVYGEGLLVGYRHFDAEDITPRFCFGHGLSYTCFAYEELELAVAPTGDWTARLGVTNFGERPGAEVVQCYVGRRTLIPGRPVRALRGVAKLRLAPGERGVASIALAHDAFSSWAPAAHAFVLEPGRYEVAVGASSRDLRSRAALEIPPGKRAP